jgi:hypothetical protein
MAYCPICLNDTLELSDNGVVDLIINNKQMDTGRFLYNMARDDSDKIFEAFTKKMEEFFEWYSNFQNQDPIKYVQLITGDFKCKNTCSIPMGTKFSVIVALFEQEKVDTAIKRIAEKYNMKVQLGEEEN